MTKFNLSLALFASSLLLFTACEPDEPSGPNEEEVITTLIYTLTPNGGGDVVTLSFRDLDGDGGNAPTISSGTLAANKTYAGVLTLLNETVTPADDITLEVLGEADAHQFFFQTNVSGLTFAYDDTDTNGKPLGVNSLVTTTAAGNGTVTVTLRHEPNKSATNVANGDITNAGGETDIEVTFNVTVN
jgi:hypothetical protein